MKQPSQNRNSVTEKKMKENRVEISMLKRFVFLTIVDYRRIILYYTVQKIKFPITDLVTFIEEILNGKLHFLCSDT